jgi:hypothetical protein
MMYDLAKEPPRPGSLLEVIFIMVQMRRELARFQETITIVQAVRDDESGDSTQKAFENYRNTLMPYLKRELEEERKRVIQALKDEANRGALSVKPILSPAMARSKLRQEMMKAKSAAKFARSR